MPQHERSGLLNIHSTCFSKPGGRRVQCALIIRNDCSLIFYSMTWLMVGVEHKSVRDDSSPQPPIFHPRGYLTWDRCLPSGCAMSKYIKWGLPMLHWSCCGSHRTSLSWAILRVTLGRPLYSPWLLTLSLSWLTPRATLSSASACTNRLPFWKASWALGHCTRLVPIEQYWLMLRRL